MLNVEPLLLTLLLPLSAGLIAYLLASQVFLRILPLDLIFPNRKFLGLNMSIIVDFAFLVLVGVSFVASVLRGFWKFDTLALFGVDFAYFDQAIWNSLNGRLLEITIVFQDSITLRDHFSPILLALVPLYAIASDPHILVVLPAVAVSFSVFPLYWFAREQLGRFLALVIAVAFFASPSIQLAAIGQFREQVLAVPLLMLAMFFLLRGHYFPFGVCLGLALLCKEEVPIIGVGLGIYIAFFQRKPSLGLALSFLSVACFLAIMLIVFPFFNGGAGYIHFGSAEFEQYNVYSYLGRNLNEIISTALTRPDLVLLEVLSGPKVDAVLGFVLPLGCIPFLGTEVAALMLPSLSYILLSKVPGIYTFESYHYYLILPFLFFGTVVGVRRLVEWKLTGSNAQDDDKLRRRKLARGVSVGIFLLGTSLSSGYFQNQAGLQDVPNPFSYHLPSRIVLGKTLARSIPQDAAVLVQTELAPLVSERRRIYIDTAIPCLGSADYVFADKGRPWYAYRKEAWDEMLASRYFETIVEQDGYVLKKRATPANPVYARFGDALTLVGYTLPLSDTVHGGQILRPVAVWQINQQVRARYVVSVQVVDSSGHVWVVDEGEPGNGFCPTDSLDQGQTLSDEYKLSLPPAIPNGNYQLTVGIYDKATGQYLDVRDVAGKSEGTDLMITALPIEKNKGSITAGELHIEQPLFVDMEEMRLLGYVPPRETISPGELLHVGVYWRAREKPRGDYVVAVQLRDAAGQVAFEQSSRPADNTYPTTEWNTGEVLLDWHDFDLPKDMATGAYQIFVLLRDSVNDRVLGQTAVSSLTVIR